MKRPGRRLRAWVATVLLLTLVAAGCERSPDPAEDPAAKLVATRFIGALVDGNTAVAKELFVEPSIITEEDDNIPHEQNQLSSEFDLRWLEGAFVGELRGTDRESGEAMVVPVKVVMEWTGDAWLVSGYQVNQEFAPSASPTSQTA